MILFGPITIEGCSYFIINLVTKAEGAAFICSEQVEVGIISLTNIKIVINFLLVRLLQPKTVSPFQPQ